MVEGGGRGVGGGDGGGNLLRDGLRDGPALAVPLLDVIVMQHHFGLCFELLCLCSPEKQSTVGGGC